MEAEVLVELKAKQVDQTFTYQIPEKYLPILQVGSRVLVPFANQKLEGFVLKIHSKEAEYSLKEILEVVDEKPILNEEMLKLGEYISKKTLSTLISAYQTMLPKALKAKHNFEVPKKYRIYLKIKEQSILKGKQLEVYNKVKEEGMLSKQEATKISSYAVKALLEKGILAEEKVEAYRINDTRKEFEEEITLNEEQQKVEKIIEEAKDKFEPFLLHGVTGSGKTEVYMHIIKSVLKRGKEAIVLVPEISLTPQMVHHFKNRFGSEVAILHSRLSEGEKYDEWRKIERKEVKIVVGARSAIFAPLKNIGVIVIDEEHSTSYKQENMPRYHAIDVAIQRAKKHQCPLILGSATPSIESYTRARSKIYTLLELKQRVNHQMPPVFLIDMKQEIRKGNRVLSGILKEKIKDRLEKKEQVILLLNRRGYSTVVSCKSCGFVAKCPNCDIPLTYHKSSNTMRCHYCGYGTSKPDICPSCKKKEMNEFGMGTQKLEEFVQNSFPKARVVRMDLDTTSNKGAHERITSAFEKGEYDILLGTQMIAKGLDFPNVTLVGVLNADTTLEIPDFRSAERTFQLLNQVAGRAGRSKKVGEVYFQCFNTDHYSIRYASTHDYQSFYKEEMRIRKILAYPPYQNLALIRIQGKELETVKKEADKIGIYCKRKLSEKTTILGPSPSNMPKQNQKYYYQIILKYKHTKDVIDSFLFLKEQYRKNNKVNVEIECDPVRL